MLGFVWIACCLLRVFSFSRPNIIAERVSAGVAMLQWAAAYSWETGTNIPPLQTTSTSGKVPVTLNQAWRWKIARKDVRLRADFARKVEESRERQREVTMILFISECKDRRGLVRPQALSQQSPTGKRDRQGWCFEYRGGYSTLYNLYSICVICCHCERVRWPGSLSGDSQLWPRWVWSHHPPRLRAGSSAALWADRGAERQRSQIPFVNHSLLTKWWIQVQIWNSARLKCIFLIINIQSY